MTTQRMRTPRRPMVAVGALAGALLLAGCGSNEPPAASGTASQPAPTTATTALSEPNSPAPGGQAGGQPTQEPGPAQTSAASKTASGRTVAGALPKDAGEYGEQLVAAWQAGNLDKVATMATDSALGTLRGTRAPSGLLRTVCEDDMCSWSNEGGARLTLTYDPAKLAAGAGHAVTAARVSAS